MIRVYLDTCCVNRPLDDQSQSRVALETHAILLVMDQVRHGDWVLIGSDVLSSELSAIHNPERRDHAEEIASAATVHVRTSAPVLQRAEALEGMGVRGYDSIHIASAEAAGADVLLTTDDALIRRARRLQHRIGVNVANPLTWLKERPE